MEYLFQDISTLIRLTPSLRTTTKSVFCVPNVHWDLLQYLGVSTVTNIYWRLMDLSKILLFHKHLSPTPPYTMDSQASANTWLQQIELIWFGWVGVAFTLYLPPTHTIKRWVQNSCCLSCLSRLVIPSVCAVRVQRTRVFIWASIFPVIDWKKQASAT